MSHIHADDGVQLYCEETGQGGPILFLHADFGGHHPGLGARRSPLLFSAPRYRCIAYCRARLCHAVGNAPNDASRPHSPGCRRRPATPGGGDNGGASASPRRTWSGCLMAATFAGIGEFAVRHPGEALHRSPLRAVRRLAAAAIRPRRPGSSRIQRLGPPPSARPSATAPPAHGQSFIAPARRAVTRAERLPRGWAEFKQQFANGSGHGPCHDDALASQGARVSRSLELARPQAAKIQDPMLVIIGGMRTIQRMASPLHLKSSRPRRGVCSSFPKTGRTINLANLSGCLQCRPCRTSTHASGTGRFMARARHAVAV